MASRKDTIQFLNNELKKKAQERGVATIADQAEVRMADVDRVKLNYAQTKSKKPSRP